MKSRPIIFKDEMVRAILENRKTQTRRVINPRSKNDFIYEPDNIYSYSIRDRHALWNSFRTQERLIEEFCPYGKPGDFLWVRESFRAVNEYGGDEWTTYAYPQYKDGQLGPIAALQEEYFYKKNKWQSSIFMPRWASRISLRIVDIKVERIQEISSLDIAKEGVEPDWTGMAKDFDQEKWGHLDLSAVSPEDVISHYENLYENFIELWDSINTKRGYPWESNPWVWIIEFERVE